MPIIAENLITYQLLCILSPVDEFNLVEILKMSRRLVFGKCSKVKSWEDEWMYRKLATC